MFENIKICMWMINSECRIVVFVGEEGKGIRKGYIVLFLFVAIFFLNWILVIIIFYIEKKKR